MIKAIAAAREETPVELLAGCAEASRDAAFGVITHAGGFSVASLLGGHPYPCKSSQETY